MIPYFVCFAIVLSFSATSEYFYKKNNKINYILFAILVVLTLSFFAGIRDLWIGNDLSVYGTNVFQGVSASLNLKSAFNNFFTQGIEPGYTLFNFIVSRISSNENFFLFIMGTVIYSATYWGIVQFRKYSQVTLSLFVYLMISYTSTFTTLRQMFAYTFIFLGIGLYLNGKKVAPIILVITSLFFHNSAIFGVVPFLLVIWMKHIKKNRNEKVICLLFIILVTVVFFSPTIINFLLSHNLISTKYSNTLMVSYGDSSAISLLNFYRLIFVGLYLLIWKDVRKNVVLLFFFSMLILEFIFLVIMKNSANIYITRLSYYFTIFTTVAYFAPLELIRQKYGMSFQRLIVTMISALLIFLFIHSTLINNINNPITQMIFPYTSQILGLN